MIFASNFVAAFVRSTQRNLISFAATVVMFGVIEPAAQGQAVSELPRAEYYVAKELYGAGRTLEAAEGFQVALNRGRRVGDVRWVDSVPPMVMLGECYYRQGNLAMALEQYDAALMLTLNNQNWINQVEVGVEQLPLLEGVAKGIDWFSKSQGSRPVAIPEAVQIAVDLSQAQAAPGGGVVAPVGMLTRLDATEVIRTLGIALQRRWQIFGPLAEKSPLAEPMVQYFSNPPRQQSAWLQSSWAVLRGLSELSSQSKVAAAESIRSGVLLGGEYDYFMSPIALLTLAEMEARQGNLPAAITILQDASLMAAEFEQHSELATSLALIGEYASASRRIDLLPALQDAATWTTKRSSLSFAAANIGAAELALYANNLPLAERLLQKATIALRARDVALPRKQAQLSFVSAAVSFAKNQGQAGIQNLDAALKLMRGSAQSGAVVEEIFQAQMTLDLLAANNLTSGDAEEILGEVLREPSTVDWQLWPLKTLAFLTTSSLPAYERHLELAVVRNDHEAVLRRMDRLQRQRFYEYLPLGGRLLAWRHAVSQDPANLSKQVRQAVQTAIANSPNLKTNLDRIQDGISKLRGWPMPLDERQLTSEQRSTFLDLQKLANTHENQLVMQSLARRPMPRTLPEVALEVPGVQAMLLEGDVLLAFATVRDGYFGFAITSDDFQRWKVGDRKTVEESLVRLTQQIGLAKQPRILPSKVMDTNADWRTTMQTLHDQLIPDAVQDLVSRSSRVLVVPSDRLWYLPFELLPDTIAQGGTPSVPWIGVRRVAYLPTIGSLPHAFQPILRVDADLGLTGELFASSKETNDRLTTKLLGRLPQATTISLQKKIESASADWLRLKADRIWATNTLLADPSGLETALMPLGPSKQSKLGRWLETPVRAPASVVLPGYTTSLVSQNGAAASFGDGSELFLTACGLLYSGCRSAIVTRWPAGGESTQHILTRYLQESAVESSSTSMRRAIISQWPTELLVSDEPVLLPAGDEEATLTSGRHPLLWAGYMAVGDTVKPRPVAPAAK